MSEDLSDPSLPYRGYYIRRAFFGQGWGAFSGGAGVAWFEAPTREELRKVVDEALDSIPDPLY